MERLRRLDQFWSWLPAFRAVAETQHLPTASTEVRVSPSALSRAIRLLEDQLATPLFVREAKRLRLNAEGSRLLDAVRYAMRSVDDAVEAIRGVALTGVVRVAIPEELAPSVLLHVGARLRELKSEIVPTYVSVAPRRVVHELEIGHVDVAVASGLPQDQGGLPEGIEVEALAPLSYGVYCGRGHALFFEATSRPSLSRRRERVLSTEHGFVAPLSDAEDHWPPEKPRRVVARARQPMVRLEACAGGAYLAVLPDIIAESEPWRGRLARVPWALERSDPLYLLRRTPLVRENRVEIIARLLRDLLGSERTPR